ncbi:MAG: hypothetical protein QOH86_702 [Sphingomonadales bacterium]|jgi:uncharacterized protein YjbI with pentapeptide repeats|nr:hypothetical protein [Sphingomonadales bacterium]
MAKQARSAAGTAQAFAQDLETRRFKAEYCGRIDLTDHREETRLVLSGVIFKDEFVADAARFASLCFENCTFEAGLKLRNGRIRGDITFRQCRFASSSAVAELGAGDSLDLRGTIVNGSAELSGVYASGACRFERMAVRGNLIVRLDSDIRGVANLSGAKVDSRLDLSGSAFSEIVLNGAMLGSLWIGRRNAVVSTGIYASDATVKTFTRLTRLTVRSCRASEGRDVTPDAAQRLHLEEPGTIAFRNCHFGSLFSTWIVKRYGEEEPNGWQPDNRVVVETAFLLTDCAIEGELTLTRLQVGRHAVDESEPDKGKSPHESAAAWGGVRLDRTRVGGAFLILSPISVAARFELSTRAREIAHAEVIAGCAMAHHLRAHMRWLSMRDFAASYVDLSGLELHACGRDDGDGKNDGCVVADRLTVTSNLTTYAWSSHLARGLPGRRAYTNVPGALRLRGAHIGELRLAAESFGVAGGKASSDGVVLELADIGQLRVPPRDPSVGCTHSNDFPVPLDLSGLTVRNWNFDEDVNAEGIGAIDHYLDFLDNDETLHREVYRSVATSLRNVGRDEDAEKVLYTEESRARWERHHPPNTWPPFARAGRPGRGLLRFWREFRSTGWHFLGWLDRWLLGYRRNPIHLFYVMSGLFLFSALCISSRPSNFELSTNARLVIENQRSDHPEDAEGIGRDLRGSGHGWGLWNDVWMTVRYHVPIIPLLVEDEYVASNDTRLDIGFPVLFQSTARSPVHRPGAWWLTAEDWFACMSLLNWVMWPLLLTFLLRRALRAERPGAG